MPLRKIRGTKDYEKLFRLDTAFTKTRGQTCAGKANLRTILQQANRANLYHQVDELISISPSIALSEQARWRTPKLLKVSILNSLAH
jgi:hypothetical protein